MSAVFHRWLAVVTLGLAASCALRAEDVAPPASPVPASPEQGLAGASDSELQMLDRFLSLPTDQLAKVRLVIERLERMTPEQRAALRARVRELGRERGAGLAEIRDLWSGLSPADRDLLRRRFFHLTPAQRLAERRRLTPLSREDRRAALEQILVELRRNPPPPVPPRGLRGESGPPPAPAAPASTPSPGP